MTHDWNTLEAELDLAISHAAEKTDGELAAKVASLTHMTEDEVKALFPTPADVQKLQKLMTIVAAARDDHTQIVRLERNIGELAATIIALLTKLM